MTWACKKQTSVSISSTNSEIVAMSKAARDGMWILKVQGELYALGLIKRCLSYVIIARIMMIDILYHISVMSSATRVSETQYEGFARGVVVTVEIVLGDRHHWLSYILNQSYPFGVG